jgi:hypothetical protein
MVCDASCANCVTHCICCGVGAASVSLSQITKHPMKLRSGSGLASDERTDGMQAMLQQAFDRSLLCK